MTWSGASSGEHFVAANPPTGSYGITSNVKVGPSSVNLQSEGVDMTGANAAANDAVITAARAKLPNGGGRLYLPAGTMLISAQIPGASGLKLFGDGPAASIVKWGGAVSGGPMIATNPIAGQNVLGFGLQDIGLDCGSISGVVALLLNSWQHGLLSDVLIQNLVGAGIAALRMEVAAGTTSANNTVGNVVRNLYIKNAPVGIQLGAQFGGSTNTFTTNNRFHDVYMESISAIGIRAVQWCDSNAFFGTEIALGTNGAIGIVLNDSATPGSDIGVYNFNFNHLSLDAFGLASATGILGNNTKQVFVDGLYHSPAAWPGGLGSLISDNSGRIISADIRNLQDASGLTNNMSWWRKGVASIDAVQTVAYAAAITPDPTAGSVYLFGPYTGAFTVNNTATPLAGQLITFKFIHDGTANAYVITWGGQWKRAGGAFANTNGANAVDMITFRCDGTNWYEVGRVLNCA